MRKFEITPVRSRVAVLASGGLDSSVLLAYLSAKGRAVHPVYVAAGLGWERDEIRLLQRFIRALGASNIATVAILKFPMDDVARTHWSVTGKGVPGFRARVESNYIPGRNLSLLTKAAVFCAMNRIGEIATAPLQSNPFPDARPEFFRAFENAAGLGLGLRLKVTTPFLGLTKREVILKGRRFPLELTMSCARPQRGLHCGNCTKCAERIDGFREAGIRDPTRYTPAHA
jgi:7-cyano-7-deazaguanine synthase